MSQEMTSGSFIADGNAINIDCGFVPDKFVAYSKLEETNPNQYVWYRQRGDTVNGNGQYGITVTGSTGVITLNASAAAGIAAYDTDADGVLIPAPNGNGEVTATVSNYDATATYTARSTTAVGSVIRPTTKNGYVYECTTASGGASGTEPTWSTTVGGTTTAGSGDVWITREESTVNNGAAGVTIGATLSTDTDEWVWDAYHFRKTTAELDSAANDPV
jgi:hypothetical protein